MAKFFKKIEKNNSDDTKTEDVCAIGNHIYFYTEVSSKSALELIKLIKELEHFIITTKNETGDDELYEDNDEEDIDIKPRYSPIYLHINSGGGCLFSCMSIIDTIKNSRVPVYTIGEGQIASAASIILLSGKKRFITENSFILIHELRTYVSGTFSNLEDDYENSKQLMKKMIKYYKKHSNIPTEVLQTLLKKDVYIDAKKSKKYGLIEKII